MQKYIFDMVCTDDTVGDNSQYKKIKFVWNINGEDKIINFYGPWFEVSCIHEKDGKEIFILWVEKAKYNFCKDDFCYS